MREEISVSFVHFVFLLPGTVPKTWEVLKEYLLDILCLFSI